MLQQDVDLSQDGCTAAWNAAWKGKTDCLTLLIERGANVNTADNVRKRGRLPTRAGLLSGRYVGVV